MAYGKYISSICLFNQGYTRELKNRRKTPCKRIWFAKSVDNLGTLKENLSKSGTDSACSSKLVRGYTDNSANVFFIKVVS